jgi:hypothetical protein
MKAGSQMDGKKTEAVLSPLEWNFEQVPDGELVACCYWEYARESAFIRDTLREYRDWFLAGGKWNEDTTKLMANLEKIQCSSRRKISRHLTPISATGASR